MTTRSTGTPESEPVKTSIAPWLSVNRATEAVDYYKAAFGAVEQYRLEDEAGKVVVAQLAIEGADFWLQGGEVVKAPYPEGNLWVATFRDPAGNVLGLWQEGPR